MSEYLHGTWWNFLIGCWKVGGFLSLSPGNGLSMMPKSLVGKTVVPGTVLKWLDRTLWTHVAVTAYIIIL